MRASLVVGLLFFSTYSWSQERFNVRFDSEFPSTNFRSVIELNNGYLCTGFLSDSIITNGRPSVYAKFSFEGIHLFNKHHGGEEPLQNRVFSAQNSDFQLLNDSTLIHSGVTFDQNSVRQGYIMKLNLDGDTLSMFRFYSPNHPSDSIFNNLLAKRIEITTDNNLLVLSGFTNPNTYNDILVQKYTPEGELIWNYEYTTEQDPDICNVILPTDDGGVVLVPKVNIEEYPLQFHDVIKLDVDGEEQWRFQTEFDQFTGTFKDAILEDNFLITASASKNGIEPGIIPAILKMDITGNLIWHTNAWENDYNSNHRATQLIKSSSGDGYILGGIHYDLITDAPDDTSGFLAKVDTEGELVWERKYKYFDLFNDEHELYDLRATSDGGYIFCGEAKGTDEDNPEVTGPYQQGWLVKVDEHGCLVEGCQQYDGINVLEVNSETTYFKLGAVPASDFLNLYQISPLGISANYTIYDMLGHEVKTIPSVDSGTTLMVDISSLASGNYMIRLVDNGKVLQTEKLIVE